MIKFTQDKLKKTTTSINKPVLYVNKIIFDTKDKNWSVRLFGASILVKFACIDQDKKERKTSQEPLSLSSLVTAYHKQPVFEMNQRFSFVDKFNIIKDSECKQWQTTLELSNMSLKENESIDISIIDSDHIDKRIKDWKKRITNLYKEVRKWIEEGNDLSMKMGQPIYMYEELMQSFAISSTEMETADILKGNKIIMTFKPKGLWMIGANGRIDIVSRIGNYIIVDQAEQFKEPQWSIYSATERQIGKPFTKKEFFNLILLLQ